MSSGERSDAYGPAHAGGSSPQVLLRYAPERVLLSGWIREPQVIENHAAWVRCEVGKGSVHLFAFNPQFRGWPQSTFPLIFRAMLLEDAAEDTSDGASAAGESGR
jgi:hypothetical protein